MAMLDQDVACPEGLAQPRQSRPEAKTAGGGVFAKNSYSFRNLLAALCQHPIWPHATVSVKKQLSSVFFAPPLRM